MEALFRRTSYYLTLAMSLLWIVQLMRFLRCINFSLIPFFIKYWRGMIAALVLTVIIFVSVPVAFKILNDEACLLSVSQSMTYEKTASEVFAAKFVYGDFVPLLEDVPKRPLLFPFAVHLIHIVSGYRYQNVFALNFIIMLVFLCMVYVVTRRFASHVTALAAMVLVVASPVFPIYGTSGGYDMFSALFFGFTVVILFRFIHHPDADTYALMWLTLLMLSNIRYESFIFWIMIHIGILKLLRWQFFKSHAYVFVLTPLLCLPYILQRVLTVGKYENPIDVPLFSFGSFVRNIHVLFVNLFNFGYYLPYAGLLNIAAILIIGYIIYRILQKGDRISRPDTHFGAIVLGCVLIHMVIILSHHAQQFDHPAQARLFFIFTVFVSLMPVIFKVMFPAFISGKTLMTGAVVLFFLYHPIAVENQFMNFLHPMRTNGICRSFLKESNTQNPLIITRWGIQYVPLGYNTINFNFFNANKDEFVAEIQAHLYDKVFIFMEVGAKTRAPLPGQGIDIDERMKLNIIKQIQVWPNRYLLIIAMEIG